MCVDNIYLPPQKCAASLTIFLFQVELFLKCHNISSKHLLLYRSLNLSIPGDITSAESWLDFADSKFSEVMKSIDRYLCNTLRFARGAIALPQVLAQISMNGTSLPAIPAYEIFSTFLSNVNDFFFTKSTRKLVKVMLSISVLIYALTANAAMAARNISREISVNSVRRVFDRTYEESEGLGTSDYIKLFLAAVIIYLSPLGPAFCYLLAAAVFVRFCKGLYDLVIWLIDMGPAFCSNLVEQFSALNGQFPP